MTDDRRVTYVPPSDKQLEQLAKDVCTHLAAAGDERYRDPQVVFGFADFLKFTTKLLVKVLNAGHDVLDKTQA